MKSETDKMPAKILTLAKQSARPNTRNEAKKAEQFVPSYSTDKPVKPKGMTKEESRHFDELCERLSDFKLDSKTFDPIIRSCARNMALEDKIRKYIAEKELVMGRPFAALKAVETQIRTALKELGLTPSAHAGIGKRRAANPRASSSTGDWENM